MPPDEPFTPTTGAFATDRMVRDWLRKPFKPEQVGKLPATQKRPALDFVGHAAVTDRLNKIAPDWSYTVDTMSELNGKVWIRGTMTIGGVSRPEFGDGDDPKEAIGNFIRRAAMRFGVAIDLWSREELDSSPAAGVSAEGTQVPPRETAASRVGKPAPEPQPSPETLGANAGDGTASAGAGPPSTTDATVPASRTYPENPMSCSHRMGNGHWVKWQVDRRPFDGRRDMYTEDEVCPKCGTPKLVAMEGTNADLGAAS